MSKNAKAYLVDQFLKRMKYWNNDKIEKEHFFASVGPDSSTEEQAWHEAINSEVKRRKLDL